MSFRTLIRALPACAVAALVIAGVAGAANSTAFADRQGDVRFAPDITRLEVANDDAGTITFRVSVLGNRTIGLPGDELGVVLDLDQNPDTGSVYYGTEVAIEFVQDKLRFFRASGASFVPAAAPASLQGSIVTGAATFSVAAADLGLSPSAGFNVFAMSNSEISGDGDEAPDIRTFNYEQVAGTPPLLPGPDTRAPLDRAFASRGVHGKVALLDYWAADGRAKTADTLRVYRRNRLMRTIRISMGDSNPFYVYYARWHVPRKVRGRLRFCVQSVDAAKNKSNLSCARLTIR
jgi:hypothetical protein